MTVLFRIGLILLTAYGLVTCSPKELPPLPSASFRPTPGTCTADGCPYTFTPDAGAGTYLWKFTNASISTSRDKEPSVTFTSGSSAKVELTVTTNGGSSKSDLTVNYTIPARPDTKPTAAFTANSTSGQSPLSVTFTDNSSSTATRWNWTFGTGASPATANTRGPHVVTYTATSGTIAAEVTLVVSTSSNVSSDPSTRVITVTAVPRPIASFTLERAECVVPCIARPYENNSQNAVSYRFSAGNNSAPESTTSISASPLFSYNMAGTYTVSLTAIAADGQFSTATQSVRVVSLPTTEVPIPEFTNSQMVLIPNDHFFIGDIRGEGNADERPAYRSIGAFYMSRYEVTQGQWRTIMGASSLPTGQPTLGDNYPVINVSYSDALAFITALNARYQNARSYSLPTEAEWELAAGGGSARVSGGLTRFGNGQTILRASEANFDAANGKQNYSETGIRRGGVLVVGSLPANRLTLFDMTGNVLEWCSDWYSPTYHADGPYLDPKGPATGTLRVLKGGSWNDVAYSCRNAFRFTFAPTAKLTGIGFRIVRRVPAP
jgi:formylglycine-generating enzyme required for sulfatase activity